MVISENKSIAAKVLKQSGMSARCISRQLEISRKSVSKLLKGNRKRPIITREVKTHIDPKLLLEIYSDCGGVIKAVHTKLKHEHSIEIPYSTLNRRCKSLKVSLDPANPLESIDAARKWLAEITYGKRTTVMIEAEVNNKKDLPALVDYIKNGRLLERKRASVVVAKRRGLNNATIAEIRITSFCDGIIVFFECALSFRKYSQCAVVCQKKSCCKIWAPSTVLKIKTPAEKGAEH